VAEVPAVAADFNANGALILVSACTVVASFNMTGRVAAITVHKVSVIAEVRVRERHEGQPVAAYRRADRSNVAGGRGACPASLDGAGAVASNHNET